MKKGRKKLGTKQIGAEEARGEMGDILRGGEQGEEEEVEQVEADDGERSF